MATQLIIPRQLDANGDPASGAKALVYETGTTTPVTVYTDTALSVAHASPIVANSAGYLAQAFYGGSIALKVVITDSADATLVTYDPVPLVSLSNAAASDVTFAPTTEIPQTDVQAAIVEPIVFDRMAAAALTGSDTKLATGTAGADGDIATWNADGDVVGGVRGGMEFIESQDASTSATLDFTGFDSARYDSYVFKFGGVVPVSDGAVFSILTSTDGGSAYDAGGSDYRVHIELRTGNTPTITEVGGTAGNVPIASLVGNATADAVSGTVEVIMPHMAVYTSIMSQATFLSSSPDGDFAAQKCMSARLSAADVDAVRFRFETGSIASGTITMYGLRNA